MIIAVYSLSLYTINMNCMVCSVLACDAPDDDIYCRGCYGKKFGAKVRNYCQLKCQPLNKKILSTDMSTFKQETTVN